MSNLITKIDIALQKALDSTAWGDVKRHLMNAKIMLKNVKPQEDAGTEFKIGDYTLKDLPRDGFMIFHESGEGGQFDAVKFHDMLHKFYKENF